MSTFAWLIIGHFVGDWLLQNDWMARGKRKSLITTAGMVHFAIYTASIICALWLAGITGKSPALVLGAIAVIFLSHWLIDATNAVDTWMRFYQQSNVAMVRLMVDQTFHLLILAALALAWQG